MCRENTIKKSIFQLEKLGYFIQLRSDKGYKDTFVNLTPFYKVRT